MTYVYIWPSFVGLEDALAQFRIGSVAGRTHIMRPRLPGHLSVFTSLPATDKFHPFHLSVQNIGTKKTITPISPFSIPRPEPTDL